MRRRALVLGACAVALLLGAVPSAVAQDAPAPPAVEAPAPEPGAAPAAEPAAPPTGEPEPVAAAEPPAAAEYAVDPTTAAAAELPAAEPAAVAAAPPAPRARPAAPAKGAPAVSAAHRPRKGVARSRPQPAANLSQADVQVSELDGRVTIRSVQVTGCGAGSCESHLADYEVLQLEVRAEAGEEPLIGVRVARVRGDIGERSVTAQVTLRPPGEPASSGEVTLPAGTDLLTRDVFAGTSLEDAYARLFSSASAVFGPGGALERLTIVFSEGTVIKGRFAAVSVSAAGRRFTVRMPVTLSGGTYVPAGPLEIDRGTADSQAPSPKRTAELRSENGDDRAPRRGVLGGIESPGDEGSPPADESESGGGDDEGGGGLFGTIISTCVLGVGACDGDGDEDEEAVRFVVDSRSVTITIDDEGRGTIEVGCPSGIEGVSGTALIQSEIRLGERPRDLSRPAGFTCDGGIVRIDFRLLDTELDRLRDARGPMTARIAVRVTGDDGLRAVDFDVVTLELATAG
jgi:hypothetical protein